LDAILKAHIEGGEDLSEIVAASDLDIDISRIINMLYRNEYKRQQAPPGPKVTTLAFGRDRRYAMTNGFKG
jgi:NAD+ synthase (glutamine-hydrolysing)